MAKVDWETLIAERNIWVAHNFPDPTGKRTPLDSVLGCLEEVGELTHAHLKQAQSIRGTNAEHEAAAKDAIGDLTVYLLGVLDAWDIVPEVGYGNNLFIDPDRAVLGLGYAVGELCDRCLYPVIADKPRIIRRLTSICECYCRLRGWDYAQIVQETWNSVKQRDWIKYPDTGLPPDEEEDWYDPAHDLAPSRED